MDPNVLRVMTDPAARNDPALLRQAMNAMHAQSRRSVLSSVRLNSVIANMAIPLLYCKYRAIAAFQWGRSVLGAPGGG